MLNTGDVVSHNTVLRRVGGGAFGDVFAVQSTGHVSPIALKLNKAPDTIGKDRFRRENEILQTLSVHPKIILPLSDILDEPPHLYYLMELADFNLQDYIEANDALDIPQRLQVFRKICEGLSHAHANQVVHRDLWWGNVLLKREEGDSYEVKLNDFGRSKAFTMQSLQSGNYTCWGNLLIRSPETYFNIWDNPVDLDKYVLVDIYALGIVLYFILMAFPTGYQLELGSSMASFAQANSFQETAPVQEREAVYEGWLAANKHKVFSSLNVLRADPPDAAGTVSRINAIIQKAAHIDYRERYSNVQELLNDLNAI